jgi:hypothetical protein
VICELGGSIAYAEVIHEQQLRRESLRQMRKKGLRKASVVAAVIVDEYFSGHFPISPSGEKQVQFIQ